MNTGRARGAVLGITIVIALGLVGCGGEESSSEPDQVDTSPAAPAEPEGLTYIALGDA